MKTQLAFLNGHPPTWSIPCISTVTGRALSQVDASYWCDNVRQPVRFQAALEYIFADAEESPEVVVEVGPHRTLVPPIKQTLSGLQRQAMVIPTLKRGGAGTKHMLEVLGQLYEKGLSVAFDVLAQQQGYEFDEDLPKHPFIRKPLTTTPEYLRRDLQNGVFHTGPTAGGMRAFNKVSVVCVDDKSFPQLREHQMGGQIIIPGVFYVEMALEVYGKLPVTIADIDFKATQYVPQASQGEPPALISLRLDGPGDMKGMTPFIVSSNPARGDYVHYEKASLTDCCSGVIVENALVDAEGNLTTTHILGGQGLVSSLRLKDLGTDGLQYLINTHSRCYAATSDEFYQKITDKGRSDWGPSFRLVQSVHVDRVANSLLATLHYDKKTEGAAVYSVQLLDSLLHFAFAGGKQKRNVFAGGIEEAHFIRKVETENLYAHITYQTDIVVGNRSMLADIALYDSEGRLCIYYHGCFSRRQSVEQDYHLCTQVWQDAEMPRCDLAIETLETKGGWGPEENDAMTRILKHRLHSAITAATTAGTTSPLLEKAQEALQTLSADVADDELDAHDVPTFNGIDLEGLLGVMAGRITGKEDTEIPEVDFSTLFGLAENKPIESKALAAWLHGSIVQAQQTTTGGARVVRVMEVAEVGSHLVLDEVFTYDLPSGVIVEYLVASHNASLLTALSTTRTIKQPKGLLVRYLLLNGGASKMVELADITVDVVVLNDWPRVGSGVWMAEGEEEPVDKMMEVLRQHLTPEAQVFLRGFGVGAPWASVMAGLLMYEPLEQQVGNDADSLTQALKRTEQVLGGYGEVSTRAFAEGAVEILACRLPGLVCLKPARLLVVADSVERGIDFQKAVQSFHPGSFTDVICMGDGDSVPDDASDEDMQKVLEAALTGGNGHAHLPLTAVVFLAGISDTSVLGKVAFHRLCKLCNVLNKMAPTIEKLNGSGGIQTALWVTTEGVNFGTIRPGQASIQGFVSTIVREMSLFHVKHIDMSDASKDLGKAAELVLARGQEMTYGIAGGQVKVPRYQRVDHEEKLSIDVLPTEPTKRFVAETDHDARGTGLSERFVVRPIDDPADDEVQVEIHATGVNFRDLMVALSLLPVKSYELSSMGPNLGIEAAGIVVKVGKAVDPTSVKLGDRVMVTAPQLCTNRLNLRAKDGFIHLPEGISLQEAASMANVYNTAHYSLVHLARVRKGERVLIHGGAGGVGHAAISICQYVGAEVFATASKAKQDIVRALGVKHVFDSRSTSWYDDVMKATGGEGVDIVLNSLSGVHQKLGMQALKSLGRFLEIGKMDIYENTKLDLLPFRKNISFYAVDMDPMNIVAQDLLVQICREALTKLRDGYYKPLPLTIFPMAKLRDALELLRSGSHIGKVTLVNYEEGPDGVSKPLPVRCLDATPAKCDDCTVLVTGATGGFGEMLVDHLFTELGVRHFIIPTRKGETDSIRAQFKYIIETPGVSVHFIAADIGKEEDVRRVVDLARSIQPPLKKIFHAAGVSVDATLADITPENFHSVAACKALAAFHLHEMTKDMELEDFVMVSSVAPILGVTGGGSYAASNAFLDALCRYRRSQGLPGTTFNMGSIGDAGILVADKRAREEQEKSGIPFLNVRHAIHLLQTGLLCKIDPIITMPVTQKLSGRVLSKAAASHLLLPVQMMGMAVMSQRLSSKKDVVAILIQELQSIVKSDNISPSAQLVTIGLDSFGFVELTGRIRENFGLEAQALNMAPDMTLDALAGNIWKAFQRSSVKSDDAVVEQEAFKNEAALHSKSDLSTFMAPDLPAAEPKSQRALTTSINRVVRAIKPAKLLLGATGLVGAHILRYLLKAGAPLVYCIVPVASPEAASRRIESSLRQLRLWKPGFAKRIRALPGSIGKPSMGVTPEHYAELQSRVGDVILAAGSRTWLGGADQMEANISATMNAVTFARKNGSSIHYASTSWLDLEEAMDDKQKESLAILPYINIKRKGEELLRYAARHHHVPCYAYRLPNVSVSSKGVHDGDLFMLLLLKLALRHGLPAELADSKMPMIPVDEAAKFIVRGVMGGRPLSFRPRNRVAITTPVWLTTLISLERQVTWAEKLVGHDVPRDVTMEDFMSDYKGEEAALMSKIMDVMITSQSMEGGNTTAKVSQPSSIAEKMYAAQYRFKERCEASLRRYISDHPELIVTEEEVVEEEQGVEEEGMEQSAQ